MEKMIKCDLEPCLVISQAEGVSKGAQTVFVPAARVCDVCFESSIRARGPTFDVSLRRNFVNRDRLSLAARDCARNRSRVVFQSDHVRDRKSEVW
jgi:hypothetical protein